MLHRVILFFSASLCAFFIYNGSLTSTYTFHKEVPPPLPISAKTALLETEKEYLLVGSNPAFHKAAPKLAEPKQQATSTPQESLFKTLVLKGTINAPGTTHDRALITDKATGKEWLLKIGDKINGRTVVRISNKKVTFQNQTEKIELTYAK